MLYLIFLLTFSILLYNAVINNVMLMNIGICVMKVLNVLLKGGEERRLERETKFNINSP